MGFFFSVIIPTFNEEKCLPRLLKNLQKQKDKSFEVIVVDADSQDHTLKLANNFINLLPLTILKAEKRNVSVQRNLGATCAKGKYLVFFDADVQIPSTYFQDLKRQIKKRNLLFVTTYLKADSPDVQDKAIAQVSSLIIGSSAIFSKPVVPGYNFVIWKPLFDHTAGFDPEVKFAEDCELAERLVRMGCRLTVLKHPRLVFSLRRYRAEGRLVVLRKQAQAGVYILTKGAITRQLFAYPMGGGWYNNSQKHAVGSQQLQRAKTSIKKFVKLLLE